LPERVMSIGNVIAAEKFTFDRLNHFEGS